MEQYWFQKIQHLDLSKDYKNIDLEIGNWLRYLFGMSMFELHKVLECIVKIFMSTILTKNNNLIHFRITFRKMQNYLHQFEH